MYSLPFGARAILNINMRIKLQFCKRGNMCNIWFCVQFCISDRFDWSSFKVALDQLATMMWKSFEVHICLYILFFVFGSQIRRFGQTVFEFNFVFWQIRDSAGDDGEDFWRQIDIYVYIIGAFCDLIVDFDEIRFLRWILFHLIRN